MLKEILHLQQRFFGRGVYAEPAEALPQNDIYKDMDNHQFVCIASVIYMGGTKQIFPVAFHSLIE